MKIKILFRYLSFIIIMILVITNNVSAQVTEEWVKLYDGPGNFVDVATSIAVDGLGNVYVTGHSCSGADYTTYDYATIKYNTDGVVAWVARYNGPVDSTDWANAIAVDGSGNVYVTGYSLGSGTALDYATIKYNSDGAEQWVARYNGPGNGDDYASSIAVDDSGNVYVTGYSKGSGTSLDYATIKYNSSGAELWVARYNGPGNSTDQAYSIALDGSGNVYVTGFSRNGVIYGTEDYATIKYNSTGTQQWVARYNGPGNNDDNAHSIAVDGSGNVYVTGYSRNGAIYGTEDYATIKYNSAGTQQWVARYNGTGNNFDYAYSIAVDGSGNVYITGESKGSGSTLDYATIKYSSTGGQQWLARYNGPGNDIDIAQSIAVDGSGNVYVTGYSKGSGTNFDYATIKYSAIGGQQWVARYNGPTNFSDQAYSIALDESGNVYVTGDCHSSGAGYNYDYATIKYSQGSSVYKPAAVEKWISGETNTIKWIDPGWSSVNIKCILNFETPQQTEYIIATGFLITNPEYVWEIPDSLLSFRSKIIIVNAANPTQTMESGVFRLKPYILTRVNNDSTYYTYKKAIDQWGFSNNQADMWPASWYNQFNYQGIDPFTNLLYSQVQGDSAFGRTRSGYRPFPDWISWVNTFGIDACYFSTAQGIYKPTALVKWWADNKVWGGSCFGIAGSNALAFGFKQEFILKYPAFPTFINPISVVSSNEVIKVINELFTNQHGNPSRANDAIKYGIMTPTATLNEIKQMLKEDNALVKALTICNNGSGGGAHTILAYGLEQDTILTNYYFIKVYDNSYPNSNNTILIDTADNGGTGLWYSDDWQGWGGNRNIYLEVTANNYLFGAFFPDAPVNKSPFILSANTLEINNTSEASINITDNQANVTGYINNIVLNEIPGSFPLILKNGSKTPPYGYSLPTDNYSVVMNNFTADTVEAFFFTGNKSFSYKRSSALQTQTDRLFFDGGVSVTNPDAQTKSVELLNIINETTQEKLCVLRSLELIQNDSVKIENPDSNKIKLISYGTAKDYDIELNYVFENGWGRFGDFNIPLIANTSHIFVPSWTDLTNNELMVLVDIGNDGIIDDTLYLNNTVDVEDQGYLGLPKEYNLAQNYPNPFNPTTKIRYQLPKNSFVTLKIFDILGREVTMLVNEEKPAGSYEVNFDAKGLSSGIYFYQLSVGGPETSSGQRIIQTRKMILVK